MTSIEDGRRVVKNSHSRCLLRKSSSCRFPTRTRWTRHWKISPTGADCALGVNGAMTTAPCHTTAVICPLKTSREQYSRLASVAGFRWRSLMVEDRINMVTICTPMHSKPSALCRSCSIKLEPRPEWCRMRMGAKKAPLGRHERKQHIKSSRCICTSAYSVQSGVRWYKKQLEVK